MLPAESFFAQIDRLPRPPRSGVVMCHKQGKTAVYVSECKQYIIEEPPHGPITRTLRGPRRPGPVTAASSTARPLIVVGTH